MIDDNGYCLSDSDGDLYEHPVVRALTATDPISGAVIDQDNSAVAMDDEKFVISQEMQFLVIPNSCFTVMFVDPEYFYYTNKTTIVFNLPQLNLD